MRIQWSSGAAQEMLDRLKRAQQGLDDCNRQSAMVTRALDDANADGDNKALNKAKSQFETHAQRLRNLAEALEDFISAIRRTDVMFEETEKENGRLFEDTDQPAASTVYSGSSRSDRYSNWGPESFTVMPGLRLNNTVVPAWLDNLASESESVPFME